MVFQVVHHYPDDARGGFAQIETFRVGLTRADYKKDFLSVQSCMYNETHKIETASQL